MPDEALDNFIEQTEQEEEAARTSSSFDFTDILLWVSAALLIDLMFAWMPIVGGIVVDIAIVCFALFFKMKGIGNESFLMTIIGWAGLSFIPFVPGCTGFVITTIIKQKFLARAGGALQQLAPVAEIAKKIPVPEVAVVGAAVSAANKVANEGQSVGSAVGGEAASLATSRAGGAVAAESAGGTSGTSVSAAAGGMPAVREQQRASQPAAGGSQELLNRGTPYAEGSPFVEGSPYADRDPETMSLQQREIARRTLQTREEALFKQFSAKNAEKDNPNKTVEAQKIWAEREKVMKEYGRFNSNEESMIQRVNAELLRAQEEGDASKAAYLKGEIGKYENEFFRKQQQKIQQKKMRKAA